MNSNYEYKLIEINNNNISVLECLVVESTADGYGFVQRTIEEWRSGKNRFSKNVEKLWGIIIDDELIGLGGLNQDPFFDESTVGRVRHVYVSRKYRGLGFSKVLMATIIDEAKGQFKTLRLSTNNPIAASLYESIGFKKIDGYKVTHQISVLD
jgi:GNAT superfamily N-acetyltransferase